MIKAEWKLPLIWITAIIFKIYSDVLFADLDNLLHLAIIFVILFGTIMIAAFAVVRHADTLAELLGEWKPLLLLMDAQPIYVQSSP